MMLPRTLMVELAGCASRLVSLYRFCTGMTLSTCGQVVSVSRLWCVRSSPIAPITMRSTPRMTCGL